MVPPQHVEVVAVEKLVQRLVRPMIVLSMVPVVHAYSGKGISPGIGACCSFGRDQECRRVQWCSILR
jgi:hypothetical protein